MEQTGEQKVDPRAARKARQRDKDTKILLREQTLVSRGVVKGACVVKSLVCALPQIGVERPQHADALHDLPDRPITTTITPFSSSVLSGVFFIPLFQS